MFKNNGTTTLGKVKGSQVGFSAGKKKVIESAGLKMRPLAKGMIVAGGAMQGVINAKNKFQDSRMGTMDGQLTTATPKMTSQGNSYSPSYSNNAGATGDLVFALNNNRRG